MKITTIVALLIAVWSLAARCNNDAVVEDAAGVSTDATSKDKNDGQNIRARVDGYLNMQLRRSMPWNFYKSLGAEAVPLLLDVLQDTSRSTQWRNAVHALGYIGDKAATQPLIKLLETTDGELPPAEYKALVDIPYSLGYLAGHGDVDALSYLIAHLPQGSFDSLKWTEGDLGELDDTDPNYAANRMRIRLEGAVISALGISKCSQARDALGVELKRLTTASPQDVHVRRRLMDVEGALQIFGATEGKTYEELFEASSDDRRRKRGSPQE